MNDKERLFAYIGGIVRAERGVLLAANAMPDHAHLLIKSHPSSSFADMMRIVKSKSTGWMHESLPGAAGFAWQEGYGAFTVSKSNVDDVMEYIQRQEEHHGRLSFQDEFIALLQRHGVEFDPAQCGASRRSGRPAPAMRA